MRILAVDDNEFVRALLPSLFRTSGYPPIQLADSASAALAILDDPSAAFDCLILDIEMPGMDGIELCARIRQMPRYRDTPIIMLTARADGPSIERAFAAGANDYIIKRFDMKAFTSRVHVAERFLSKSDANLTVDPALLGAGDPAGRHPFDLSQSFRISGVDRLILPFSLGNYLTQLPASEIEVCRIFAMRIEDIDQIYHRSNSRAFVDVLAGVVGALAGVVSTSRLLMAYTGEGTFMCITRGLDLPVGCLLQADLRGALGALTARSAFGPHIPVEVQVGNPIVPHGIRTQRVRKSFGRAQERISPRPAARQSALRMA
ncbi:response regulator [Oceaniglobus trochenteri]|uniref:response regulator n=1 Tax=Oceaniglobus trochenteri TaxID=2763260 RepID=UPI001CFFFFCF|nr:response regulator [Oceaniglobus trochenteri]